MSKRAREFVAAWIDEHVQVEPYFSEDGSDMRPSAFAIN
jgi:hypothetical protein